MKKIILTSALLLLAIGVNAQINTGSQPNNLADRNTFLDASGFNEYPETIGKGLNFPRTNLTTWTFDTTTDLGQFQYFQSAFDGMVVYNIATGKTGANAATQGQQVDVEPGFYYFYNPTGNESSTDVSTGKWVRIGGGNATNTGVQRVTGTFTHDGGNTAVLTAVPTSATQIVSMSIYRISEAGKGLVGTSVYSYDIATQRVAFGMGEILSVSYPSGTYEYVVEYK